MEVDPLAENVVISSTPTDKEETNQHAYDFVIQTVYEKCKKEKENKKLTFPLNAEDIRVSYYTGVPLSYLERFCTADDAVEEVEFPVDISVRKKIYAFLRDRYASLTLPTLNALSIAAQSQLSTVDLQRMLTAMGFDYRKTTIGHLTLIENPSIAAQRFEYLTKVIKLRKAKKTIYYVDEAYVNSQQEIVKIVPATETSDKELIDAYTFYYATCHKGLVNALFCNKRNRQDFDKWFAGTILKSMEPSSVIVMMRTYDAAHQVSRYSTKQVLVNILKQNDVPHRYDMHKSQLYDLIMKFRLLEKRPHPFEELVKARGLQLLFLPRPLYDLTVGELALNLLKESVHIDSGDNLRAVKDKVLNLFDNISSSLWAGFNGKIEALEKELYDIEVATDRALELIY